MWSNSWTLYKVIVSGFTLLFGIKILLLGDKNKIQNLVQTTWTFVNDRSVVCEKSRFGFTVNFCDLLLIIGLTLGSSLSSIAMHMFIFSLCTNLCLQWEPDIIAVSLMYLSSRLTKVELSDWEGKVIGSKAKWYDFMVPDVTLDIMEGSCVCVEVVLIVL